MFTFCFHNILRHNGKYLQRRAKSTFGRNYIFHHKNFSLQVFFLSYWLDYFYSQTFSLYLVSFFLFLSLTNFLFSSFYRSLSHAPFLSLPLYFYFLSIFLIFFSFVYFSLFLYRPRSTTNNQTNEIACAQVWEKMQKIWNRKKLSRKHNNTKTKQREIKERAKRETECIVVRDDTAACIFSLSSLSLSLSPTRWVVATTRTWSCRPARACTKGGSFAWTCAPWETKESEGKILVRCQTLTGEGLLKFFFVP